MTEQTLFQETFSCLHASDTVCEEVLSMAEQKSKKKRRLTKKAAILCAAATAACTMTVWAAVQSGFFQSIWGNKGQKNVETHRVTDGGQSWTSPSREWKEVDDAAAGKLASGFVGQIGASATVYGYTLTAEEYLMDENGIGAITYTLSNPDGLRGIAFNEYGEYYVTPECPMKEIWMETSGKKAICVKSIADQTQTTDTTLHAVMYFAPFEETEKGETLFLHHYGYESDAEGRIFSEEAQDISFTPDRLLASAVYTSDAGYTARISPLGIVFQGPVFESADPAWTLQKLSVSRYDGSVYPVRDKDVSNAILGCIGSGGDTFLVFNRLVDPGAVASITVNDPDGEDLLFRAAP